MARTEADLARLSRPTREAARLALAIDGIAFEDDRVAFAGRPSKGGAHTCTDESVAHNQAEELK